MSLRDFALLVLMCFVWATNTIVSKIVIAHWGVPPLFYAGARFMVVMLCTLPWLLPAPRPLWRLIVVCQLIGGANFALMFMGLQTASPSAASIVIQLGVPMTTVLSMVMLGEQVRWRRGIGMALTLAGAVTVMWRPEGMAMSVGLWLVAAAALAGSLGAVMMKQMEGVKPLQFQAWVGFTSALPLLGFSAMSEHGQWTAALAAGWPFVGAVLYSAIVISVIAHTTYYGLIQKYEATLISPLVLMTPLFTIILGVLVTHDHFDARMAVGAALALAGVLIVALRPNHVMPLLLLMRNRVQ
ncbi:MAG: DMT family transporter [Caulobacterales bacterium]|nr:DMT family transporter [Caulobacterales bacterium]